MGPGKAAAFGPAEGKPVFCLPGGPPSNHIAFLELALPAWSVEDVRDERYGIANREDAAGRYYPGDRSTGHNSYTAAW